MKTQKWLEGIILTAFSLSLTSAWMLPVKAAEFVPPGANAPTSATGGASRDSGSCLTGTQASNFVPVLPQSNIGLTVKERPTFFVNLPQNSAKGILLSVQDEDRTYYYKTTVNSPKKAGVFAITLPEDAPALEVGKNYQWHVVLLCNEQLEPDSPSVSGWVKRVEVAALETEATPSAKSVSLYGERGIWYDMLSSLAELRNSQPDNAALVTDWQNLLVSVGLEEVASQPLNQ